MIYSNFTNKEDYFRCRVCGLKDLDPPWGENGQCPTYNICSCCGTEAGYNDWSLEEIRETRKKWLDRGFPWREPKERPRDWDLEEQLKQIPNEFI